MSRNNKLTAFLIIIAFNNTYAVTKRTLFESNEIEKILGRANTFHELGKIHEAYENPEICSMIMNRKVHEKSLREAGRQFHVEDPKKTFAREKARQELERRKKQKEEKPKKRKSRKARARAAKAKRKSAALQATLNTATAAAAAAPTTN